MKAAAFRCIVDAATCQQIRLGQEALATASSSNGVGWQLDPGARDVLPQVGHRRCPGDEKGGGRALQEPGERDLEGGRVEPGGDAAERVGLDGLEAAEWKKDV